VSEEKPEGVTEKRPPAGAWASLKAGLKRTPTRKQDRGHPAFWSANFIKTVGVPAALAFALLRAWQGSLADERLLRAEQHKALLEAFEAERGSMGEVRVSLEGLTQQAQQLHGAAATVQGMVLGRLRCPDLSCPRCPQAPPCPEPQGPIIVTGPAAALPTVERPSREVEKWEQHGLPTRPRREP
jgi:hypothetical protein